MDTLTINQLHEQKD